MPYTLDLLADDPSHLEISRKTIIEQAERFQKSYFANHPKKSPLDQKLSSFFRNLNNACFWGVLAYLDGTNNELQPTPPPEKKEARAWAVANFALPELHTILNICVNQALLVPFKTSSPGTYRGHSILLRELVEKTDSLFYGFVDEPLKKRLYNGRFWEELPNMMECLNGGVVYHHIEDVLINNFSALDLDFAPQGFQIFYRNGGYKDFDLNEISLPAVDNYFSFIKKIDEHHQDLNLKRGDLAYLIRPYLLATLDTGHDAYGNSVPEPRFVNFKERLKEPPLPAYLTSSDLIKSAFAEKLGLWAVYRTDMSNFLIDIFSCLPNPQEISDCLIAQMPDYDLVCFAENFKANLSALTPFFSLESIQKLKCRRYSTSL